MTAIGSAPEPQSKSALLRWVIANTRSGTKNSRYPMAVSRIITGSHARARFWFMNRVGRPACNAGPERRWASRCSPSANRLDGAQAPVGQGLGEVFGFLTEVGDEGVQAQWAVGLGQDGLHERRRLVGEVVPRFDGETRGFDRGTQLVGGDQVAARGVVGPGQGIVQLTGITNRDVPEGKSPAVPEHAMR